MVSRETPHKSRTAHNTVTPIVSRKASRGTSSQPAIPPFSPSPTRSAVGRVLALRHDALQAVPRALCQQGAAVGEALAEADQVALGLASNALSCPSVHERQLAEVAPVQLE
jgi:hypothetical protein